MNRRTTLVFAAAFAAASTTPCAWGQAAYPDKVVRIILPYAAGVSPDVVARLNSEIVKIVKTQDMQDRLRAFGLTPTGTSAEYLGKELAGDYEYWGKIVRDLGVKVE